MKNKQKRGFFVLFKVNLKILAAAMAIALGTAAFFTVSALEREEGVEVPVVMYHSVLKDEKYHGKYVISPAEFENDLQYLEAHGYTTILIQDLINYTKGGELPEKPVLLTFDDGYYNNYLYAFELAKQYQCKFVISPIVYYTDQYSESQEKESAYYSHATWQELKEMVDSGLVEVQNHSYNLHQGQGSTLGVKQLPGEGAAQYEKRLSEDLSTAQRKIEENLGMRPTAMVYPFGAVSESTPEIVKRLGFSVSLSCEEKISRVTRDPNSLYGLGRFLRVSGGTSTDFFQNRVKLPAEGGRK